MTDRRRVVYNPRTQTSYRMQENHSKNRAVQGSSWEDTIRANDRVILKKFG